MTFAAKAETRPGDQPCRQIAHYAKGLKPDAWAHGDKALNPVLKIGEARSTYAPLTGPGVATPFERSLAQLPEVQEAVSDKDGSWTIFIEHLPGIHLYVAFSRQGTLHCQITAFVRAGPGEQTRLVKGPPTFEDGLCWTQSGDVAQAFGRPVFVTHGAVSQVDVDEDIQVTPWVSGGWGMACRFGLRFRTDFHLAKRICVQRAVCEAAAPAVRNIAIAYNRMRQDDHDQPSLSYGSAPTGKDAADIRAWIDKNNTALPSPDFPKFGGQQGGGFSYSGLAMFPITLAGRTRLAVIGHEGVGWREGGNTLLAFYDLKDGSPVALAGFILPLSITGLSAAMVEKPIPVGGEDR